MIQDINNLIKSIYQYYPIGINVSNTEYQGQNELKSIIEDKIGSLIKNELPVEIENLKSQLLNIFGKAVFFEFEKQFPSYSVSMPLLVKESEEFSVQYILKLKVSLLTNYFTIFHEEQIQHKNASMSMRSFMPIRTSVLSSMSLISDSENEKFNIFKQAVIYALPDYQFIQHAILFNRLVATGLPYGVDESLGNRFPIYAFLFDNEYCFGNNFFVGF